MTAYPNDQGLPGGAIPVWIAARAAAVEPGTPFPATIAGGATWDSGVIDGAGYASVAAGATLSQTGSMVLTRYLDAAGTSVLDTATAAMTAATPASVSLTSAGPWLSFRLTIQNTSGSAGNLTNAAISAG